MKIFRLIILIPGIIVAMVLINIFTELSFGVIDYFKEEPSPLSFIWDSFLKSVIITFSASFSAMYIYPYEKKYPSLIIVTILYIVLHILLSYSFIGLSEYMGNIKFTRKSIISQVANIIGSIVALGYLWNGAYKDEIKQIK